MSTLIGKVKSLVATPHGGTALTIKGVRTAKVTKNFGTQLDHDPDSDVPDAYQGNWVQRVELSMRDRDLALALWNNPCLDSLNLVMARPKLACSGSSAYADSVTVVGTTMVVDGDIEPGAAGTDGLPTEYTVAFVVVRNDEGVPGTLTVTKAGA